MDLHQSIVLAAIGDWVAALLLVLLILSWWTFIVWWVSRFGARDVDVRFASSASPEEALHDWSEYYALWLDSGGYYTTDRGPDRIEYVARYRPRWEIAVALLLFPVGLVALLGSNLAYVTVTSSSEGIKVAGTMHRRMANELEKDAAVGGSFGSPAAAPV